ncbi:MAG: hypothetical protein DSY59_05920 [Persephonella sp.]|nr:MAG: hypothetical protein DSY59_05920 [Persephonella sp.]
MEGILQGKFSNPSNRNIYWLFTIDQIKKYPWISYFGNWDFNKQKGKHQFLHNLGICKIKKKYFLVCSKGKVIDIKNGLILFKLKNKLLGQKLKLFVIRDTSGKLLRYVYKKHSRGLYLEGIKVGNGIIYFLVNKPTFYSMFNQMYILRNYDKNYFELVYDHFPVSVLYKVKVK